jgi:hypothetical protein
MALLLDLRSAGAAATQTLGHLNLTHTPIYLQVVLMKPEVSQYHVLVAKTGYSEVSTFGVVSVPENCVYHLADGPCFIGHTINIVHWDGARKGSGSELVLPNVVSVDEKSISSTVKKCLHRLGLLGVSCHNLDLDVQGVCRGGGSDHILLWKPERSLELAEFPEFLELIAHLEQSFRQSDLLNCLLLNTLQGH